MVSYVSVVAGHMPPKFQSMLLADGQFYPAIIGQFYPAIIGQFYAAIDIVGGCFKYIA